MENEAQRQIDAFAADQEGHITRPQLRAAGASKSTVQRRIEAGHFVVVGSSALRLASTPPSRRGDVVAACLETGGVASHRTAAWWHGLADPPETVDVTVRRVKAGQQRTKRPHGPSIAIHTTTNLPAEDILRVGSIGITSVARTALGLGALVVDGSVDPSVLTKFVGRAVDADLASDPWLWWMLARRRCRGRSGVSALDEVLAHRARLGPTESWLEREVLRILEEANVRLPRTQRVVRRSGRFAARVDFLYEVEGIVLEALGYAFHRTPAQLEADTRRANALQLLGLEVFQFTTSQVVRSPASLVATVEGALERTGSDPRSTGGLILPRGQRRPTEHSSLPGSAA